jgi:ribosomal protein L23
MIKTVQDIIIRPIITEASMAMGDQKKYIFAVKKPQSRRSLKRSKSFSRWMLNASTPLT